MSFQCDRGTKPSLEEGGDLATLHWGFTGTRGVQSSTKWVHQPFSVPHPNRETQSTVFSVDCG